jgi:transposase-like protein
MKTSKFSEEQVVKILEEGDKSEQTVDELCRKHGIHKQTYYGWRKKYGSLNTTDLQRMQKGKIRILTGSRRAVSRISPAKGALVASDGFFAEHRGFGEHSLTELQGRSIWRRSS